MGRLARRVPASDQEGKGMSDELTEKAIVFKERLTEIATDARTKRDRSKRGILIWGIVFAVAFVAQNTYFGWNMRPMSDAERITDMLHVIPFVLGAGNLMSYVICKTIAEILS